LYLPELEEEFVPLILKDTPDVLTMGRRCMREGYSFYWAAYSNQPYFQKPDGTRILLKVDNYVPYLVTDLEESATVVDAPGNVRCADSVRAGHGVNKTVKEAATPVTAVENSSPSGSSTYAPDDRERSPASDGDSSPAGARGRSADAAATPGRSSGSGDSPDVDFPRGAAAGSAAGTPPAAGGSSPFRRDDDFRDDDFRRDSGVQVEIDEAHGGEDEQEYHVDDPFDAPEPDEGATHVNVRRDLAAEAKSLQHQLLHATKNPHCPMCVMAFGQRKPNRRRKNITEYKEFGDAITMDHVDANSEEMRGIEGGRDLLVIYDLATGCLGAYPVNTKSSVEVLQR